MSVKIDGVQGVWRTIGGRRVFIKDGQNLSDAMKESGKFKLSKKQKEAGDRLNEKARKNAEDDIKFYLDGNNENWDSDGDFIRELAAEYGLETEETKKMFNDIKRNNLENKYKEYLKNYDYEKNMPEGAKFNKMLEESGVRTFADDIKEREQRRSESRNQLLQQKIKYANTQKGLKSMVDNDLATDITRYSFEDNEKLRRKHGKLEKIKTVKGVYGTSGALLRSRETGEYFVITARNSNIDYWI